MNISWHDLFHIQHRVPRAYQEGKIQLTRQFVLLLIPIEIIFSLYYWSMGEPMLVAENVGYILLLIIMATWLFKAYPRALPHAAAISITCDLLYGFNNPMPFDFILIWMVIVPFAYLSVLGLRLGLLYSGLLLLFTLAFAYLYADILPYQPMQIAIFSLAYTVQTVLAVIVAFFAISLRNQAQETHSTAMVWQSVLDQMPEAMIIVNQEGDIITSNRAAKALDMDMRKPINAKYCASILAEHCQNKPQGDCHDCSMFNAIKQHEVSQTEFFDAAANKWFMVSTSPLKHNTSRQETALVTLQDTSRQHAQEKARSQRLFHFQSMQHINLVIAESRGTQKTLFNLLSAIRVIFKADRVCLLTPEEHEPKKSARGARKCWQVPVLVAAESVAHIEMKTLKVSPQMDDILHNALTEPHPIIVSATDSQSLNPKYLIQNQLIFSIQSKVGHACVIALHRCSSDKPWDDNACRVLAAITDRISDVLDAWQLNESLERRNDQYKQLVENMPDGVVIMQQNRIVFANEVMQDMLGEDFGDQSSGCVGKHIAKYIHPDFLQASLQRFDFALKGKRNPIHEIKLIDCYGELLDVISSSMAISYQGLPAIQIIMRDVTRRNQLDQALHSSLDSNNQLARQLINVQEQERIAIAQDLHDDSGQILTAMSMNLQSIKNHVDDDKLLGRLIETEKMVDQMFKSIRSSLKTLNPTHIDVLGLADALRSELETWSLRYHIAVSVDIDQDMVLPQAEIATTIFRVVQEAFTNIAKHAHASHVQVSLQQTSQQPPTIRLRIADDGVGFRSQKVQKKGYGLMGMESRTGLVSGVFHLESEPHKGTTIQADFPLHDSEEAPNNTESDKEIEI